MEAIGSEVSDRVGNEKRDDAADDNDEDPDGVVTHSDYGKQVLLVEKIKRTQLNEEKEPTDGKTYRQSIGQKRFNC